MKYRLSEIERPITNTYMHASNMLEITNYKADWDREITTDKMPPSVKPDICQQSNHRRIHNGRYHVLQPKE